MTTKMTKKDYFTALLAIEEVASNEELVSFINKELEQLAKKSGSARPKTENQEKNEGLKDMILEVLRNGGRATLTQIQNENADLAELSNQKLNALMIQLVKDGKVIRTVERRKAYFEVA